MLLAVRDPLPNPFAANHDPASNYTPMRMPRLLLALRLGWLDDCVGAVRRRLSHVSDLPRDTPLGPRHISLWSFLGLAVLSAIGCHQGTIMSRLPGTAPTVFGAIDRLA